MSQQPTSAGRNRPVVVITGASGFLGTHLARLCGEREHYVIGVNRKPAQHDYCDEQIVVTDVSSAPWDRIFEQHQPSTVYHLAATASVQASLQDPIGDFNNVIPATARMMVSLSTHSPATRIVFFSSAAVYGNPLKLPVSEQDKCAPISPYGANKYVAEELLRAFGHCYSLKCSVLRIFSAYGEGLRRQLFFDVAAKAAHARSQGKREIILFGTGEESRDFIHGEDVARAALAVAEAASDENLEVYNVANGEEVRVKDAVDQFLEMAGLNIKSHFNGSIRAGDPRYWKADISKITKIHHSHSIPLDVGLERYAEWLKREGCI